MDDRLGDAVRREAAAIEDLRVAEKALRRIADADCTVLTAQAKNPKPHVRIVAAMALRQIESQRRRRWTFREREAS